MRKLLPTSWLREQHQARKADDPAITIPDDVALVKALPVETKALEDGDVEFIISTADVDRESDIIRVDGWDLSNFVRNPVVLFAHDYWSPPVGQAVRTWVDGGALRSRCHFTEPDLYAFGAMIGQMYARGFMRAVSVGFRPYEWTFDEERFGINFLRQELLEYSCVPVPANPEALIQARSAGIDISPLKAWAERALDELRGTAKGTGLRAERLERMRRIADPAGRSLAVVVGELKLPGTSPTKEDAHADAPAHDPADAGRDEGRGAAADAAAATREDVTRDPDLATVTTVTTIGNASYSVTVTARAQDPQALRALIAAAVAELKGEEAPATDPPADPPTDPTTDPPPADPTTDPPDGGTPAPPVEEASATGAETAAADGELVLVLADEPVEPTYEVDPALIAAAVREATDAALGRACGRVD